MFNSASWTLVTSEDSEDNVASFFVRSSSTNENDRKMSMLF